MHAVPLLSTDGDIKIQPERRLYTVSLPPPGYVPSPPEPASCADSGKASSDGDTEGKKSGQGDRVLFLSLLSGVTSFLGLVN